MAKKKVANRLREIGDAGSRGAAMPPMPGRASETQLVELGLFISVTVVGTFFLVILAVFFGVSAVENHLETSAEGIVETYVLAAAEEDPGFRRLTDVSAEASGTNVHLRGTVDLEVMKEDIPELVMGIEGVGNVTAELEWVPPVEIDQPRIVAEPITIIWVNGSATINGEVSDDVTQTAVVDELNRLFSAGVDSAGFVVKEGAPSERDWLSKIFTLMQIGANSLDEGELFISAKDRLIQMNGEYETRQLRREARDAIDVAVGETTFVFVSGLAIPEPPAFTPEEVIELQENLDDLIEGKVVEFELNSDVLTPVGAALLDEIIDALEKFPAVPIEIGGHTDNQGEVADNLDLSERRANTALEYLVANGQDPVRFVVVGYGEDVPLVPNDTAAGRARNRRIEFRALGE
jgi:OOP family OmpA-OmpF porin